jgi:hypothetical protein
MPCWDSNPCLPELIVDSGAYEPRDHGGWLIMSVDMGRYAEVWVTGVKAELPIASR